jgi:hypothetical protein
MSHALWPVSCCVSVGGGKAGWFNISRCVLSVTSRLPTAAGMAREQLTHTLLVLLRQVDKASVHLCAQNSEKAVPVHSCFFARLPRRGA